MMNRRKFDPLPPSAPHAYARTLKVRERDEHLIRRLGSALVLQWDALPDDLQDLLIDQAVIVEDPTEAPNVRGDIETFLRTAKSAPLKALAPES
ncbi:MAG: hypothetical protein ABUL42_04260 [Terricaulis silvestris]